MDAEAERRREKSHKKRTEERPRVKMGRMGLGRDKICKGDFVKKVLQRNKVNNMAIVRCILSISKIFPRSYFSDASSHLYKRVCPSVLLSVCPLVRPLCKCKNCVPRLFSATVISYTETNDQPKCFESIHPSVRPSVSPCICHMINTR